MINFYLLEPTPTNNKILLNDIDYEVPFHIFNNNFDGWVEAKYTKSIKTFIDSVNDVFLTVHGIHNKDYIFWVSDYEIDFINNIIKINFAHLLSGGEETRKCNIFERPIIPLNYGDVITDYLDVSKYLAIYTNIAGSLTSTLKGLVKGQMKLWNIDNFELFITSLTFDTTNALINDYYKSNTQDFIIGKFGNLRFGSLREFIISFCKDNFLHVTFEWLSSSSKIRMSIDPIMKSEDKIFEQDKDFIIKKLSQEANIVKDNHTAIMAYEDLHGNLLYKYQLQTLGSNDFLVDTQGHVESTRHYREQFKLVYREKDAKLSKEAILKQAYQSMKVAKQNSIIEASLRLTSKYKIGDTINVVYDKKEYNLILSEYTLTKDGGDFADIVLGTKKYGLMNVHRYKNKLVKGENND